MTHASLFSGIGGFDLAAEWMGWTNVFNCEWEEFPRKVLKHHFPNAIQHGDIQELDATAYAGRIDILTGGFPCQPYSLAGKRKGKEDERHLWPEMLRVIRECAPRYVVGENVRGLVGWNGGMVFEEVCADLEAQGYAVQPFLLPAAGVGAPHRRDRVWFVAHADDKRGSNGHGKVQGPDGEVRQRDDRSKPCDAGGGNASDTKVPRGEGERIQGQGQVQFNGRGGKDMAAAWQEFPTFTPVCGADDGLSRVLDGITFPKWRRESIKAYGNAIVPQVALQIFKAIEAYERQILL
jgi:DNA (cytosine-5)-methyltransferase 1